MAAIKATWVIAVAALATLRIAHATEATQLLDTVTVVATGMSSMSAASAGDISREQMLSQPLLRPAAMLENIPGLMVTQHSGEGKANQYFLRAFNLDHGTDLAIEVDDMPVNLPTHAHGQGYSDLNFLIPQLAADLHYKKGPYYADEGTSPRRAPHGSASSMRCRPRHHWSTGRTATAACSAWVQRRSPAAPYRVRARFTTMTVLSRFRTTTTASTEFCATTMATIETSTP